MPEEQPSSDQQYQFALAMAAGQKISVWARKNEVPLRTCYNWTKTKEYQFTVREVRRRALDCAAGQFTRSVAKAVGQISRLANEAQSESVQLQAARLVIKESVKLREHVDLEEQMDDIERRLDERDGKIL
jgi:hypothetical protein